jgi:hypothetical protein
MRLTIATMLYYARLARKNAQYSSVSAKIHLKANTVSSLKKFSSRESLKSHGRNKPVTSYVMKCLKRTETFLGFPIPSPWTTSSCYSRAQTFGLDFLRCSNPFVALPERELLRTTFPN